MVLPLYRINPGETGAITLLANDENMAGRLRDLGFEPGARVACVLKGQKRHIAAYLVRNAVIALREEDSRLIFVELDSNASEGGTEAIAGSGAEPEACSCREARP